MFWHEPTPRPPGTGLLGGHPPPDVLAVLHDPSRSPPRRPRSGRGTTAQGPAAGFVTGVMLNMSDPRPTPASGPREPARSRPRSIEALEPWLHERTAAILDAVADRAVRLPRRRRRRAAAADDRHDARRASGGPPPALRLDRRSSTTGTGTRRAAATRSPRPASRAAVYGDEQIADRRAHPTDDLLSQVGCTPPSLGRTARPRRCPRRSSRRSSPAVHRRRRDDPSHRRRPARLLEHPDQLARLQADRACSPRGRGGAAVDERHRHNRRTAELRHRGSPATASGRGRPALVPVGEPGRRAVFADPLRSTSGGPEPAPGLRPRPAPLPRRPARPAEIAIVLAAVLERFDDLALAGPAEWGQQQTHQPAPPPRSPSGTVDVAGRRHHRRPVVLGVAAWSRRVPATMRHRRRQEVASDHEHHRAASVHDVGPGHRRRGPSPTWSRRRGRTSRAARSGVARRRRRSSRAGTASPTWRPASRSTAETTFDAVASVSKQFTAAAVLLLADRGDLARRPGVSSPSPSCPRPTPP